MLDIAPGYRDQLPLKFCLFPGGASRRLDGGRNHDRDAYGGGCDGDYDDGYDGRDDGGYGLGSDGTERYEWSCDLNLLDRLPRNELHRYRYHMHCWWWCDIG